MGLPSRAQDSGDRRVEGGSGRLAPAKQLHLEPRPQVGVAFETKANCQDGIDLVKAQAPAATAQDLT